MIELKVNDMLVFEDEEGNIYQDCVCGIGNTVFGNHICNDFVLSKIKLMNSFNLETNCKIESHRFPDKKFILKEVWRRTDSSTYKKKYVWSKEFNQLIPYVEGRVTPVDVTTSPYDKEIDDMIKNYISTLNSVKYKLAPNSPCNGCTDNDDNHFMLHCAMCPKYIEYVSKEENLCKFKN